MFLVPASAAAQIYYVDQASSACSSAGPGTEAAPYCTIASALNAHSGPGITIRVKPGTYREQVTVNASGTSGSPLVIQALGTGVIIDGADSFATPAQWVLLSGNVYRAAGVTWAPLQVFKNGARLTPSTSAPASLPSNSFTWVTGEGLYVNAGGGNPGSQQLLVGNRPYGFSINGKSWITIDGFDVRHAEDRGFNLGTGCANLVLSHNAVSFSHGYGMRVYGSTSITVQDNTVSDGNFHGIGLLANSTGCILRRNETFNNADPTVSRANGIYLLTSPGNTLAANRVHDNQDSGILFTDGANNCISYNNVSWKNGDHGIDHLSSTGTIHSNDVVFGNNRDGFSIEGSASGTQLHNCIAIDNGLTTARYDLWVDVTSTTGFVSDYNIFWNSTSQSPIKYIATPHATLGTYQAASGQDAHSLQADPRFANAPNADFHLLSNSPAIDAANSGAPNWPSTDAGGSARVNIASVPNTGAGSITYSDRGAYEFSGNQAPVVTAPATATVAENAPLTVNVTAADFDGQAITSLTASGLPTGATFTPGAGNTSGTLTWTPTFTQSGTYSITFTATNTSSGSATTQVTVTNVDRAPVVTAPSTASVAENALLTVNVTVSDPDGEAITSLTASLPTGATFTPGAGNTTGTLTWTPNFTQSGNYNIAFTATNALSGSKTTAVTVTNTNRPPEVVAPATATGAENVPFTLTVTASDPDGSSISSLTASGRPTGASFSTNNGNTVGTLTWTPSFTQNGTYTIIFTASNSLTGRDTTVITIANTDRAPVVTAPATATVAENAPLTVNVTASDPDNQTITSLAASGLPAGATFTPGAGNTTGKLTWTPDFTQSGSHSITFTATNALSGSSTTTVTVGNLDRAPAVTAPPTASVAEGALLTFDVTATDPDAQAITSLTATGLPAGATFTPGAGNASGTMSWTPGFTQSGNYSITFTATNALSGSAITQVTVGNIDRAPVVTAPATASVAEGALLTVNVSAADPDGGAIASLTAADLPAGATFTPGPGNTSGTLSWTPGMNQSGSYSITFTAQNALSGTATTALTVTNSDRAPVVTAPDSVTVWETQPLTVEVSAVDPDGEAIDSLTVTGLPPGATFVPGQGNTTGTLKWTPSVGNAGARTVVVTAHNASTGAATTFIQVNQPTAGVTGDGAIRLAPRVLPNPMRGSGHLRFGISTDGAVRVDIFDLGGRRIATPMDESQARAGEFVIPLGSPGWGAGALSPGLYFYRVRTPDGTTRGRFMVRR